MKRIFRIMLLVAAITIFSITGAGIAYADSPLTLSLPVEIAVSGDTSDTAEEFAVRIAPTSDDCPMPEGTVDNVYTEVCSGTGSKTLPSITFTELGVYNYTITQVQGTNTDYEYDDTVYILTVYITSTEDHEGLEMTAVLSPDAGGPKQTVAVFNNIYTTDATPTPESSSPSSSTDIPSTPSDHPKTGDTSPVVAYAIVFAFCATALVLVWCRSRKWA